MTQQPFSRPGAIDLSGLSQPAPGAGAPSASGSYAVGVTEQNFQEVVEASLTAPVVLVLHSPSRSPESTTYADDVATVVAGYEGRFLAGLVDVDHAPQIAAALQVQQIPVMMVLVDGRPATQPIPGVLRSDELSALLDQLAQQMTAQGIGGRHQPRSNPV
ncbi:co-chaperone YbbN, partial [Nocardioides hankookensis]